VTGNYMRPGTGAYPLRGHNNVQGASDAGLRLQPVNSATADVRVARVPLASLDSRLALAGLAARLGLPQPRFADDSADSLYLAENALLQSQRVIPLLYLRNAVALSPRVKDWTEGQDGDWQLENVWLGTEKP